MNSLIFLFSNATLNVSNWSILFILLKMDRILVRWNIFVMIMTEFVYKNTITWLTTYTCILGRIYYTYIYKQDLMREYRSQRVCLQYVLPQSPYNQNINCTLLNYLEEIKFPFYTLHFMYTKQNKTSITFQKKKILPREDSLIMFPTWLVTHSPIPLFSESGANYINN